MKYISLLLLALLFGNSAQAGTIDFEGNFVNGTRRYVEDGMKLHCTNGIFMNYTGAGKKGIGFSAGHFYADGLKGAGELSFLTEPVQLQYLHIAAAIPPGGQRVILIGYQKGKEVGRTSITVRTNYMRVQPGNWPKIDKLAVFTPMYVGVRIDRIGYQITHPNIWLATTDNANGTADWDDSTNWSEGIPGADQEVVIPLVKNGRYPVSTSAISVKHLRITPHARMFLHHPLTISGEASGLNNIHGTGEITVSATVSKEKVDFGGIGLELSAGTGKDLGKTTVTRTTHRSLSKGLISRAFLIRPSRNQEISATMMFAYSDEEIAEIKEEGISLYSYDKDGWKMAGGILDTENNTLTLSGISHFSLWSVGKENLFPLDLLSFRQAEGTNSLHFTWHTTSESQVRGYYFQHLSEEEEGTHRFGDLEFIPGAGTTNKPQQYRYEVQNLYPGKHVFRLKQIYADGRFLYSRRVDLRVVQTPAFTMIFEYGIPEEPSPILLQLTKHRAVTVTLVDENLESQGILYEGQMDAGPMYELRLPEGLKSSQKYFLKFFSESGSFFYQLNG